MPGRDTSGSEELLEISHSRVLDGAMEMTQWVVLDT